MMAAHVPISPMRGTHRPDLDDRPLRDLVKETWEDAEKLFRQELELAISDLEARAKRLKTELIRASLAGSIVFAGVLALLAAAILLLSLAMAPWGAALIVGAAAALVGFLLLTKAKKGFEPDDLKPERTVRSVRTDMQMLKEAIK